MRRRTRIVVSLGVITAAAFGGTYAAVASRGVPARPPAQTAVQTARESEDDGNVPSAFAPPVVHGRTRAS